MQERQRDLQTPFQVVSTKFRNSKRETERKLTEVLKTIVDLRNTKNCSREELASILAADKQKLKDVKRKLSQNSKEQGEIYQLCRKRIHKHEEWDAGDRQENCENDVKLKDTFHRQVISFLNCQGKHKEAEEIQQDLKIEDLTRMETELYSSADAITREIANNNLRGIKLWCFQNTHMLAKVQSPLEYKLISCEYINILNNTEHSRAIDFLRKSLQTLTLSKEEKADIGKLTILLLTQDNAEINIKPYLNEMNTIFLDAFSKIYHINLESQFEKTLGIGISSLKTSCCSKEGLINPKICPVCQPRINQISKKVPMMTKHESSIICRLNGSLMNERNPPIALPNGQVYSLSGLQQTLKNGKYLCPNTQTFYEKNLCKKVYLA